MSDYKTTLGFLQKGITKMILKSMWLMVMLDGIEFLVKWQIFKENQQSGVVLSFYTGHIVFLLLVLGGIGVLLSGHQFGGYISILANRKRCLQGIISYSLIVSCIGTLLMRGFTFILTESIGRLSQLPYRSFQSWSLLEDLFLSLLSISVGLLIGALFYRLHRRSFVLGLCVLAFIGIKVFERYQLSPWYERMNGFSPILVGSIAIPVFIGLTVVLLYKAPIKAYAHNWL
ncbi:hypothetical protein [Cellulosilyticum lentocellum]|uniref:Uncharacterized protein n=1 Tax=Cellulosilyticum lentocellum (strain ATCC 49066 / DSM 5427 / NCIMB 11756 / RHM5) TaxID=642492 RepID=F2JHA3_CELLD|nr:hypothetical protein [Cellulosilyticum lentocellum]ADZ83001.1 hypothetical protein Clole_1274 [Cellulosilyticum lentocellum DSM 5427]